jgi:hypothetical protein
MFFRRIGKRIEDTGLSGVTDAGDMATKLMSGESNSIQNAIRSLRLSG